MGKVGVLAVGLLALGLVVATGCKMTPTIQIPDYSEAKDLKKVGDYAGAIEKFNAYIQNNKDGILVPYAKFHIADCYREMGDVEKAKAAYNALIKEHADSEPAAWAKKDLDMIKEHPEIMLPGRVEEAPAAPAEGKKEEK